MSDLHGGRTCGFIRLDMFAAIEGGCALIPATSDILDDIAESAELIDRVELLARISSLGETALRRNVALEADNAALRRYAKACRDEAEAIRYRLRGVASWYRKTSALYFEVSDIPILKQPEPFTI